MSRETLIFYRNGEIVELNNVSPDAMLLDYLRLEEKKTGTKEGCNEGDCGACSVALGRIRGGKLTYEPVNACIQLLGQIDGADIITVDDLAKNGKLHSVQKAMVDEHGSQCGFCTPGIVMSMFTLHHSSEKSKRSDINEFLAGNLCRCTGYRPIVDAALKVSGKKPNDALAKRLKETEKNLLKLKHDDDLFIGDDKRFFAAPASIGALAKLSAAHFDATILAGATDVGLWITKHLVELPKIIHVGRAKGFDDINDSAKQLVLGAGATYETAFESLAKLHPDIKQVLLRLGSRHVRASGTIGGNLANGSPIGDMPPMLIALEAKLELLHGKTKRKIALEDFFIAYKKQDRKAGELVSKIIIPKLKKHEHYKAWKISKRFDQDISALMFAAKFEISGRNIKSAIIACGGMAGIPQRAKNVETALLGISLDEPDSWNVILDLFEKDYAPMSDMRSSSNYRMQTAKNLLLKALYELAEDDVSQTRLPLNREAAQ